MRNALIIISALLLMACNNNNEELTKREKGYNNESFQVPAGKMTPETLWSMGRIGEVALSPDDKQLAYTVTWFNIEENKSYRDIHLYDMESGKKHQLTNSEYKESGIVWRPDGKKLGFLSNKSGRMQIWEMNPDGSKQTIISDIEGDINGFKYAPDMTHILFTKDVKINPSVEDKHPDLGKANAKIVDDLMYRHWDHWVDGQFSHIFLANYPGEEKRLSPKQPIS